MVNGTHKCLCLRSNIYWSSFIPLFPASPTPNPSTVLSVLPLRRIPSPFIALRSRLSGPDDCYLFCNELPAFLQSNLHAAARGIFEKIQIMSSPSLYPLKSSSPLPLKQNPNSSWWLSESQHLSSHLRLRLLTLLLAGSGQLGL